MPHVTQRTEMPGKYQDCFLAVRNQMLKGASKKKYTPEEIDVMVKQSMILKAEDKIEFSLRGQIKRGKPGKMGISEDEFENEWRIKMKKRLEQDGFPFKLTKEEQLVLDGIKERKQKEAVKELSEMTGNALKNILASIE